MRLSVSSLFLRISLPISWLIFVVGQIYLLPKVIDNTDGLDFRLIWLAGSLWADGISPYSQEFAIAYSEKFGQGPLSHFWVYPSSFHPIAGLLSQFDFHAALQIWNSINFIIIHISSFFVARAVAISPHDSVLAIYLVTAGAACLMQATAVALAIGQTSFLIYLGVALLVYGWGGGRLSKTAVTMGLVAAGLKPSVGLVLFCAAIVRRDLRFSAMLAVLIHMMLAVISASKTGFLSDLIGFLQAVARYEAEGGPANAPQNLVGLVQLIDLSGFDINGNLLLLIACAIAVLAARRASTAQKYAVFIISIIGFLVTPLHSYDLTFVAVAVAVAMTCERPVYLVPFLLGFTLIFRSDNMQIATGVGNPIGEIFPGSMIATIGVLIMTVTALVCPLKSGPP